MVLLFLFCIVIGGFNGFGGMPFLALIGFAFMALGALRGVRTVSGGKRSEFLMLSSLGVRMPSSREQAIDLRWGEITGISGDTFLDFILIAARGHTHQVPGCFRPRGWDLRRFSTYFVDYARRSGVALGAEAGPAKNDCVTEPMGRSGAEV